jgi:hypothetical protein
MRLTAISTFRRSRIPIFLLCVFCTASFAIGISDDAVRRGGAQQPLGRIADSGEEPILDKLEESHTLPALLNALDVLHEDYFAIWQGIWPTSIDWTSAVIGTYVSSALSTLSTSFSSLSITKEHENLVNKYFSQLTASYFGQDAFALRQEAYDDMLWVVLGWLESIKFITTHSILHYDAQPSSSDHWYGEQWIPAFAHRARIFWELASQGWDTKLCDGGMIWSPYLAPYKNAITNELYISASISMYLYFPGDDNTSPFGFSTPKMSVKGYVAPPRDPKYLAASIEAYKWLNNSNMTDAKGLYVDGYHVSGWRRERSKNDTSSNTRCDTRNEMVYTYNQGVLLSGQRGLYEATGAKSYLEDGHKLIADVIAATGWDLTSNSPPALHNGNRTRPKLGKWHGLGRSGVLEEACDAPGYCSQDSQTFKGIFFHHLTLFCAHLPQHLVLPGNGFISKEADFDFDADMKWHDVQCKSYGAWIKHNAHAALTTKDTEGRFGTWWGAPPSSSTPTDLDDLVDLPNEAVDYRNLGVPEEWKEKRTWNYLGMEEGKASNAQFESEREIGVRDLNDRGRGRTVETQGGGVAVLRALWEVVDSR